MNTSNSNEQLDERFDSGQPVPTSELVLDRGDFSSEERMHKYFEAHPEAPREAYDYFLNEKEKHKNASSTPGMTQTVTAETRAGGTLVYTLTGFHYANVVQTCYIGSTYLYTTQQINNPGVGATQYITRFRLPSKSETRSTELTAMDEMKLLRFGHGETLQWFENAAGTAYFWVVCKATQVDNPDADVDYDWATQLCRVQYVGSTIGSSVGTDYTQFARISSLNRANDKGTSFGTLKRCEAALDSSRTYLLIWTMNTSDTVQFTYYKASEINAVLDTYETQTSKYVSAKTLTSHCVASYSVSSFYSMVYDGSIQGIEFNDTQHIYISSGDKYHAPHIQKGTWGTDDFASNAITITGGLLSSPGENANQVETEGIMLKGDYVYLNVTTHNDGVRRVYTVPKTAFN